MLCDIKQAHFQLYYSMLCTFILKNLKKFNMEKVFENDNMNNLENWNMRRHLMNPLYNTIIKGKKCLNQLFSDVFVILIINQICLIIMT